jgi:hypothetical protein
MSKKFLILGNMNAITYKEVFSNIKNNSIWLYNNSIVKKFIQPDGSIKKFGNILWFSNIYHKGNKPLDLTKEFNQKDYPVYDNYDAINVSSVYNIPKDYYGNIGVPLTFIYKDFSNQFEIIDLITPKLNKKYIYKRLIIKRKI